MPSRLRAVARYCGSAFVALSATLAFTAVAQASPTTKTLPPQNITPTSALLEGQGTCDPGATCKAFFHWRHTGGTWYNVPTISHTCSSSSPCGWSQTYNLPGLQPGNTYAYVLCSNENNSGYTCYGPTGTNTSLQGFATAWLAPSDLTPPSTSGTTTQFGTVYESHGSWTQSPTSYGYQWQDCDSTGANCAAIPGATAQSYIAGAADVGHTLRVVETAANSGGTGTPATSAPSAVVSANTTMTTLGTLGFNGSFQSTTSPWTSTGGGPQCANYGTPSLSPRLRGNLNFVSDPTGAPGFAGQFTLPADSNTTTYPLEGCDLVTGNQPMNVGSDQYYGVMVYVPFGWSIPNNSFWGIAIKEFHFQNIWGAPIEFQLHNNHVTLAVETGPCSNYTSSTPGCEYRSNADSGYCPNTSSVVCLPSYYAIPPGGLVQGQWNEILMHVHWAADSTGQFQTWYRTAGSPTWNQSSGANGFPTVQWNNSGTCCKSSYVDLTEVYAAAMTAPVSVWLRNDVVGSGFNAVASTMP